MNYSLAVRSILLAAPFALIASACGQEPSNTEAIFARIPEALGNYTAFRAEGSPAVVYRNEADGAVKPIRVYIEAHGDRMRFSHLGAILGTRRAEGVPIIEGAFVQSRKFAGFEGLFVKFEDASGKGIDGNGIRQIWLLKQNDVIFDVQVVSSDEAQSKSARQLIENDLFGGIVPADEGIEER